MIKIISDSDHYFDDFVKHERARKGEVGGFKLSKLEIKANYTFLYFLVTNAVKKQNMQLS